VTERRPRLRFAPSPTGYLHVGGARTVLFNWFEARRTGGEFLLRIEDTDTERNRPELAQNILDMLEWLGLGWDGAPTHQSERLDLYTGAAQRLLDGGRAYWCDCTSEQVQARNKEAGGPPGYDGFCRDRGLERSPATALRFRSPDDGSTTFEDLIRGQVTVENRTLEDFVLLRSSGTPTFLLANIVDDADMDITHVVRGEEHVNGTPKYLCLADALGLDYRPVFAHLPVLVNEQRQKLSKRRDSVSVQEFKDAGYLPAAMVNYLALLGWGPREGDEVRAHPLEEFTELFRLGDVSPSPAFFDVKKLQAFNADHLRFLSVADFEAAARPFLSHGDAAASVLAPIAPLVQERVRLLTEVEPMIAFLLDEPLEVDDDAWQKAMVKGKAAPEMLDAAARELSELPAWTAEAIRAAIEAAAVAAGLTNAEGQPQLSKAQAPVRVATTGRTVGPPLFESLEALGRERTLARLREARARL
jgi:glutamyl-tRNA synthetase